MPKPKIDKTKISKNSKLKQKFPIVKICVNAKPNNTLIALTDIEGRVIAWSTSGKVGFKGTKKATPFASQKVTEEILEKARMVDANSCHLIINGTGMGRDSFLRAIQNSSLQIESIKDITGFPFGGVKAHNKRRI